MELAECTACHAPAAWNCLKCGPKCALHIRRVKGPGRRFVCPACRGDGELRWAKRSELERFDARVKPAARVIARPLLAAILAALVLSSSWVLGLVGTILGAAVLGLVAVRVARAQASAEEFDWPAASNLAEEAGQPLMNAAIAALPLLVLAWVLVLGPVVTPWELEKGHEHSLIVTLLRAPGFWGAVLVGLAWAPIGLLLATVATTPGAAANPVPIVKLAVVHPREYGLLVAFGGATFVLVFALRALLPGWLAVFPASLAVAYGTVAAAQAAGALVRIRADEFGWGGEDEARVDLGDPHEPAYDEPAPVAAPAAVRSASLESQIIAALEAKDVELVVKLYEGAANAMDQLSPATLVRVGQDAASAARHHLALAALNAAGRGTGPDSAKALVIAARIHDERLRDQDAARKLYEQVLQRFPDSKAAEFARKQLADPRFMFRR